MMQSSISAPWFGQIGLGTQYRLPAGISYMKNLVTLKFGDKMKLEELLKKFHLHDVPERWYCINVGLKYNAYVIFENYGLWECFYLGERGDRNDPTFYRTAEEAYDWLWEKIKKDLSVFRKN